MITQNPYDSRGLKWVKNDDSVNAINRYIVTDYIYSQSSQMLRLRDFQGDHQTLKPVILYGTTLEEKDISPLAHPLINSKNKWIALDLRPVVNVDKETKKVSVRNDSEFQLAVQRFVLTGLFAVGKRSGLYNIKLPQFVFGDWLASSLTHKFGLTPGDQTRLAVLAMLYYQRLFTNQPFTEEDLSKFKLRLKKEFYGEDTIDEVVTKAGVLETLDDLCKAFYSVTENVRLKNMDYNVLVSVVSNSWFGINAHETTILALSHPPTWIAMVFASLTQRSFRSSSVSKTVEQRSKRGADEEFLKELSHLTAPYKEE